MPKFEELELRICDDCVMITTNGMTSAESGRDETDIKAEQLAINWPANEWIITTIENEFHFGNNRCDGCDETLAGYRIDAIAQSVKPID